jgi:predicted ArsR family transcriptional regulator
MFSKVLRDIAKPQWIEIISILKRSTGMSVAELAKRLKMSYMGVKQHCVELQKRGYLDTWRRPKNIGRPEKAYRLTTKVNALFPQIGNELTLEILEAVEQTYGANASEKLLFTYFHKMTDRYVSKVKGETVAERTASLAKVRDLEGYLSSCDLEEVEEFGLRVIEYHSPFTDVSAKYPIALRMEEQMFEKILGAPVHREEERASGLVRYTFKVEA